MSETLTKKHCVPCEGGVPTLTEAEIQKYLKEVKDWAYVPEKRCIKKSFLLPSFKKAVAFVNKVADLAEEEGHHPDIYIYYKKVEFAIWTHAIGGLSENDFILAAKIDALR